MKFKKKKFKTKKSVSKRIKVTGRGKFLRHKAGRRHLLAGKTSRRKRKLRRAALISKADVRMIKSMLPYA
jgi:large subunit ribosomal protein L35